MLTNLAPSLAKVLVYEGGYVNDPRDPGGATYQGVTQRTYDSFRDRMKLIRRSVKLMTPDERQAIYQTGYWTPIGANALPSGVDLVAFDYSVNSGPAKSLKALKSCTKSTAVATIQAICSSRLSFLRGLKTWGAFGKGWQARVTNVEATGLKWAGGDLPTIAASHTKASAAHKKAASGVGGAAVTTGATTATPALPHIPWELLAIGGALAALLGAYFIYQSFISAQRASATLAVANGKY